MLFVRQRPVLKITNLSELAGVVAAAKGKEVVEGGSVVTITLTLQSQCIL